MASTNLRETKNPAIRMRRRVGGSVLSQFTSHATGSHTPNGEDSETGNVKFVGQGGGGIARNRWCGKGKNGGATPATRCHSLFRLFSGTNGLHEEAGDGREACNWAAGASIGRRTGNRIDSSAIPSAVGGAIAIVHEADGHSKTGAAEKGQIYMQAGLDYGAEEYHGKITGLATS